MLLCADPDAASTDLASGALACPSCRDGRLRAWGWGRERAIRTGAGASRLVRPRRGQCRSCGATHVLLPSWAVPRRADAVRVIARAAAASVLHGTGTARLGVQLGVPAATVRGWLRRLRDRAGQLLQEASSESAAWSPSSRPPRAVIPARRGRPGRRSATPWPWSPRARMPLSAGTAAALPISTRCRAGSASPPLSPSLPEADPAVPAWASSCPEPARDAQHDHPGVIRCASRHHEHPGDTMSMAAISGARNARFQVLIASDVAMLILNVGQQRMRITGLSGCGRAHRLPSSHALRIGVRRVLPVRDIRGVVTHRCGGARVGGRQVSRLLAGVSRPVVSTPQARQQRDRVAAGLDTGHTGHTGHYAGARLPVVRDSIHDPRELASTLKFAPRSNPAGTTRCWHLRRRSWRPANLAELRVLGPTEFPQVRVSGVVPHRIPTDKTAFPGTRRHGC